MFIKTLKKIEITLQSGINLCECVKTFEKLSIFVHFIIFMNVSSASRKKNNSAIFWNFNKIGSVTKRYSWKTNTVYL